MYAGILGGGNSLRLFSWEGKKGSTEEKEELGRERKEEERGELEKNYGGKEGKAIRKNAGEKGRM